MVITIENTKPRNPNTETFHSKGGILANIRIEDPIADADMIMAITKRLIVFLISLNPFIL